MKSSLLLLSFCLLLACQSGHKPQKTAAQSFLFKESPEGIQEKKYQIEEDSLFDINRYILSTRPSSIEITVINESCGILLPIDTLKMDQLKGKTESELEKFYIAADDLVNADYEAREYLKKKNMKSVHPKTRYLEFVVSGKTVVLDTRPDHASGWGYAILYKKGKMPKLIYSIDVPFAYEDYFNN